MATSPTSTPSTAERPPLRWIAWTCEACKRANRTRTRTGSRMTCPGCQHVQLGPEAQEQHQARLAKIKARQQRKAKAAAAPSSTKARVQGTPSAPAASPPSDQPSPPTPPAPPPAKRDLSWFDRALGYGG